MPYSKNALQRYRILDSCFSNFNKKFFIDDLIEACKIGLSASAMTNVQVSRRQIFLDIEYMESFEGWEIPLNRFKEGKKTYYQYSDRTYTIQNSPLNHQQFNQLKDTLELVTSMKGIPETNQFIPILEKLTQNKNIEIKKIISFEDNEYLEGYNWFSVVFQALKTNTVLKIAYQSFKQSQIETFNLHPYYLKQHNNRWFLFGYHEEYKIPTWNIALDRIVNIEIIDTPFQNNTFIDYEFYFDDIVGVTMYENQKIESIKIEILSTYAPYVASKPLHPSQKKLKQLLNGNYLLELELIPNHELYALLMSNIDKFKILEPDLIKAEINKRLQNAIGLNKLA